MHICGYSAEYEYDPPINYDDLRRKTRKSCPGKDCEGTLYFKPKNIPAITIEIRDPDSANDLEGIKVVLTGKNTKDVVAGENIAVLGDIVVVENNGKGYSVVFAKKIKYEKQGEEIKMSLEDTKQIYEFAESRHQNKNVIRDLVPKVAPSVIGHEIKKEGMLLSAVMTPEDQPRRRDENQYLIYRSSRNCQDRVTSWRYRSGAR